MLSSLHNQKIMISGNYTALNKLLETVKTVEYDVYHFQTILAMLPNTTSHLCNFNKS